MSTADIDPAAVAFFREHAGYSYNPRTETAEEGRERCARDLAAAEQRFRDDEDVFVVWQVDDIDSSFWEETGEPHALFCALLCVDCDAAGADVVRGWDPQDGIFERPGRVVGSFGGIDLGPYPKHDDPYKRVVIAEMYAEFEHEREANLVRGEN